MRNFLQQLFPSRERRIMAVIVALAVISMLTGVGQGVREGYENLASAERLSTVAQLLSGPPRHPVPVTFLDVDDKSRAAWEATGDTPHGALAALVHVASSGAGKELARAIVFDFDLSRGPGEPADPALDSLLRTYPAAAPPLLLVRRIRVVSEGAGREQAAAAVTPYDAAVASKPNITWITSLNDIGADRSVGRIRLWQQVCDAAGNTVYPSAALTVAAIIGQHMGALHDFTARLAEQGCDPPAGTDSEAPGWPQAGQRVVQLPYVFGDVRGPAGIAMPDGDGVLVRRITASLLVQKDAASASGAATFTGAEDIDRDPFAGRVVIIGASFADSGDIHRTPMGPMPGALIIANAVTQARSLVGAAAAPAWLTNVLAALLFLSLVWVVRTFYGAIAVLLIGVVSLDVLWAISHVLGFAAGLDVVAAALPALAVYKLINSLLTVALKYPAKGWRAVLNS